MFSVYRTLFDWPSDPPEVTFAQDPPESQPLREGDDLQLTCSVQGKPDPTSVTLTRERTSEVLENVQTTELTHTINSLSCLDTDLYICSGQNSQGTSTESISVKVRCEYCNNHCSQFFGHISKQWQSPSWRNSICMFHRHNAQFTYVGYDTISFNRLVFGKKRLKHDYLTQKLRFG